MLKSKYKNLKEIPKWAREANLFVQNETGEYVLRVSEIEGIAELTTPGLAANRDAFRDEKDVAIKARDAAVERAEKAEKELNQLRQPGGVVLGPDDASEWNNFKQLGTHKEVKEKLDELDEKTGKLEKIEANEKRSTFAKDAKLNPEVLNDWFNSDRGTGITNYFTKTEKVKNHKGIEEDVSVAYVTIETEENGKTKTEDFRLLDYAQKKLPDYQYKALTSIEKDEQDKKPTEENRSAFIPTFRQPQDQKKSETGTIDESDRPVDVYNKQRTVKKSPFSTTN